MHYAIQIATCHQVYNYNTVELLYYGYHWDHKECPN